jgi:hypothetical protein
LYFGDPGQQLERSDGVVDGDADELRHQRWLIAIDPAADKKA